MTTPAAERLYLAQHEHEWEGRGWAVYNPRDADVASLPVIYGFNNGGSPGWYNALLIASDGTCFGGHVCSHEGYMPHDLGIMEGSRPDRHETFRTHFPEGYRMEMVEGVVTQHKGLMTAYALNQEKGLEAVASQSASAEE